MVFVSNLSGVDNLFSYDRETGVLRRLTDVLGGIFHPSVSTETDRLVFTAFTRAGFDIFVREGFSQLRAEADFPQLPDKDMAAMPVRGIDPVEGLQSSAGASLEGSATLIR